ncbi:MAG: DNA-directed RNA polymerase subunit omega [Acidobacteriota bacterium]
MADEKDTNWTSDIDSKYRLVLIAARRSKQLQKGAPARVKSNAKKFTRIALEEAEQGEILFSQIQKSGALNE